MTGVSLQQLSDCGLNPFAVQLLVESWRRHPEPKPVAFLFNGVLITLGQNPNQIQALPELLGVCEKLIWDFPDLAELVSGDHAKKLAAELIARAVTAAAKARSKE